jgi:hypothetical protein
MKHDSIISLFFIYIVCIFEHCFASFWVQVSTFTDQPIQASAATTVDLDNDEGLENAGRSISRNLPFLHLKFNLYIAVEMFKSSKYSKFYL